jgi:hypothetical protein
MSIRNGDKSRYHRMRKKRISLRERNRSLLAGAATAGGTKGAAEKTPARSNQPAKPKLSR